MKKTDKRFFVFILYASISVSIYGQCFDMSNLNSSNIVCTTGTFDNPYMSTGVVPGRHTIMSNVNAYDDNVPQLRTIPIGETNAIRLGNDRTGAEAESITFLHTYS